MLKEKIHSDLNQAVRERNEIASLNLRMLLAAILFKEKEKRYKISKENTEKSEEEIVKKSNLSDEEIIEVVSFRLSKREKRRSC